MRQTRTTKAVGLIAAYALLLSAVPLPVRASHPGDVEEEGTLEIAIGDDLEKKVSNVFYYLRTPDGRRYELNFAGGRPEAGPQARVRVRGMRHGHIIQVPIGTRSDSFAVTDPGTGTGTAAQSAVAAVNKKTAVILFNFTNDTSQPFTVDQIRRVVFTNNDSADAFYTEQSFNKLGLTGKVRSDGDVFGWYTLSQTGQSPCYYDNWANAANSKAQAAGVDLSGYDNFIYIWPRIEGCGFSGIATIGGNRAYLNPRRDISETSLAALTVHEMGHNFGTAHANKYDCTSGGARVSIAAPGSCTMGEYGDPFDIMGGGYHHMNAIHKHKLGYFNSGNVLTWSADGEYTIAPLETATTGVQAVRISRSAGDSATRYYYLEFRQPYGFDNFGPSHPAVNGVTVRVGPEYTAHFGYPNKGTALIDMTPETAGFGDATLAVGKTFYDSLDNFHITVLSVSPSGATVRIKRGAPLAGDATPPAISSVQATDITASGARIIWNTNEGATSQVEYGLTTSYGSATSVTASLATSHSVSLSGLEAGKTYNYRVKSKDAAGNLAVSGNYAFTTPGGTSDTTPPTISSVQATEVNSSGAKITWTTNEASDSQVEYGLTTGYGSATPINTSLVTTHAANLSGLQAGKTYNYRVKSRDAAGNLAVSGNFAFTTPGGTSDTTPPTISSVQATEVNSSGAKITWFTNEASDSQVEYGLTTGYGSATRMNGNLVTSHAATLSGLQAGKTYNYRVKSRDAAGNLAVSGNFAFTTTAATVSPPAAPSSLTASPDTTLGGIRLSWTDNSSNEEGFKIERKPYGGVYAQIATVGANVRAYHDTTATNMYTIYVYRVRAYNAGGHSAYSNEAYTRPYRKGQAALAGQSAEKFLSPGLADGRNDNAVFGPEAEEVVIVDANGSLVFQGMSDGTGPIVWDGKGRDGHVAPSGAYIAQIKQEDGQVVYQTLAIVK